VISIARVRPGERTRGWYRRAMAGRRRGPVFPDRFHEEIIKSPQQARRVCPAKKTVSTLRAV